MIQPYKWYNTKAQVLEERYRRHYRRRVIHESDPREARRSRMSDLGEGPSRIVHEQAHCKATTQDVGAAITHKATDHMYGGQHQGVTQHVNAEHVHDAPDNSDMVVVNYVNVHDGDIDRTSNDDPNTVDSIDNNTLDLTGGGPLQHNPQIESRTSRTLDIVMCTRKREGEMDTNVVILKSQSEDEMSLFETKVVSLSHEVTLKHPTLFLGPRDVYTSVPEVQIYTYSNTLCVLTVPEY